MSKLDKVYVLYFLEEDDTLAEYVLVYEASWNDYPMLFQWERCPKISNILAGMSDLTSVEL